MSILAQFKQVVIELYIMKYHDHVATSTWMHVGDMQLLDKASRVVSDLAEAQQSNHNGYLYAYPSYHFDLLHTQAATHSMANITQDWGWYVPLYVVSSFNRMIAHESIIPSRSMS